MTWVISGPITVSVEVVDTITAARRNVVFDVPTLDYMFAAMVERRWRKSFAEIAWRAANENDGGTAA